MIARNSAGWRGGMVLLLILLFAGSEALAQGCRIGFDLGSTGVRVGSATHPEQAKVAIDYLADIRANHAIDRTIEPTIEALTTLPKVANLPADCTAVAGGYSAWRLALREASPARLAATLRTIHERTHVALFIIPQDVEGNYGYLAAKSLLGAALKTPFILDLGGGSMQIAGATSGWGSDLGQKSWHDLFCKQIQGNSDPVCPANPVGGKAPGRAATLLAPQVAAAKAALGTGLTLTAVTPPVVNAVHPVVRFLAETHRGVTTAVDAQGFSHAALVQAIAQLATRDNAAITELLDGCREQTGQPICAPRLLPMLVTDMLLLHAFMDGLGIARLEVAAAGINNVPGILADPRAAAWAGHYPCYLQKLAEIGGEAFKADPRACGPESGVDRP
ncbi:MAG: hypothetical protein HQL66_04670 [Magnetococcales bacterium]|nr:hypothetical protein [Magnetococcales bacterium]